MSGDAVELFFSYSHKDEALRDQLATHLKLLERQGIISAWHDRKIVPGSEWAGDINQYLNQADIILLLVSADFLASDYCWDIEIQKALTRHDAGEATVIPVILRPVDWSSAPFARLQALPKDAQPVMTWNLPDLAFMDIAKGIRFKAEELVTARRERENQAHQQAALEHYRQKVRSYLAFGSITFIARENLNDVARSLGLSQAEMDAVETQETAIRNAYLENLERYGQTFRRALDHEYPLSENTTAHLKERQVLLKLDEQDVQQIEQRILGDWQTEQRQLQEQTLAEQRQREQEEAEQMRQQQLDAERQEQERQQHVEAERLQQQQAEIERLRQQQEDAKRQEQESQEREQQEQAAESARLTQQRQQEAEAAANRQTAAEQQHRSSGQPTMSRRRALQILGFGSGGLVAAVAGNYVLTKSESPTVSEPQTISEPPAIYEASPDDLSLVEFESITVDETGGIVDRTAGQANVFREELGNSIGLDMVQIPEGEFEMGSPPEEEGRYDAEGPQRRVAVSSFFMGQFPVTQAQYEAVMGENPSSFQENGVNRPVEQVSWDDAIAFCERLSQLTGRTYRLPSEAEWEYACRAGTTTPFHFGETITTDLANYHGQDFEYEGTTYPGNYGEGPYGTFREKTTEVGSFSPNAFGLYDMHGNVWEWCQDIWHETYDNAPTDGSAWIEGGDQSRRVLRGGSWFFTPRLCRSADRGWRARDYFSRTAGFRVVVSPVRGLL